MSFKQDWMTSKSENLCFFLFFFSLSLTVFHILPPFLSRFSVWPLTWGDTLDFLTPFGVIPFAYVLYLRLNRMSLAAHNREIASHSSNILAKVILAIGFISYVEGHGLHLAANSIARLVQTMKDSEVFKATYLFDEVISHFIWIGGLSLISLGLILLAHRISFKLVVRKSMILLSVGSGFYGVTFTVEAIEGQTVVWAFPAAIAGFLLSLFLLLKRKRDAGKNPILVFFLIAYLFSIILFAFWGVTQSGFPQFSELGWI
jgi:hypothetical protein